MRMTKRLSSLWRILLQTSINILYIDTIYMFRQRIKPDQQPYHIQKYHLLNVYCGVSHLWNKSIFTTMCESCKIIECAQFRYFEIGKIILFVKVCAINEWDELRKFPNLLFEEKRVYKCWIVCLASCSKDVNVLIIICDLVNGKTASVENIFGFLIIWKWMVSWSGTCGDIRTIRPTYAVKIKNINTINEVQHDYQKNINPINTKGFKRIWNMLNEQRIEKWN